jgi:glucose-1-phosphate thymidylyltransferase
MILWPLQTLLNAGIRDIALITNPGDITAFEKLLGDGSAFGVSLTYLPQPQPAGIAEGLLLAADFLDGSPCLLILGDNLFDGPELPQFLTSSLIPTDDAIVFCREVAAPGDYGILSRDSTGQPQAIVEKPAASPSSLAITGLYAYPADAPSFAARLAPSPRGELEISDLNQLYLEAGRLHAIDLPEDCDWQDMGTHAGLAKAQNL